MNAPETPGEFLAIINQWQRQHEQREASPQRDAMTLVYDAMRDLFPSADGSPPKGIPMSPLRTALAEAFPDLQQQVHDANAAAG